jgi:23S rRNA (guanosine2251-2'-O)-methyltransferase
MKRNNYYTLFGLNNTISVLEANECLEINVDIVEGSRLEKDTKLINLLKQRQISSSLLEKKVFNKKFSEKRNQGVSVSFNYDLIKTKTPNYFNKENSCYLVLDQINDPQNFGQIIRTAECSGVDGIIYSKHNSVPITNSVLQVSQGAFLNMSIFEVTNIKNEIKKMKKSGFWSIGIENSISASNWYDIDYKGKIIIVFGSEGKGIRHQVLKACDFKGTIDMQGKINSLNVSASVSAILFERLRQLKTIT